MPRHSGSLGPTIGAGLLVVVATGCIGTPQPEADPSRDQAASSRSGAAAGSDPAVPPELEPFLAGRPHRPGSAREAAEMITAAQTVVRSRRPGRDLLAAAGHAEQLAVREVSGRPWLRRVLSLVRPSLRPGLRANVAARRELRSMHASDPARLATELPAWRVVPPAPARVLVASYREAERRYGVDWEYLAAINMVETAFGRIRGTSVAGAQGPMQFIPSTWDLYGEGGDIDDAHDAILAAARLLRANGFARDKAAALWRYNNHWAYVRGVTHHAEVVRRDPRQLRGYLAWQVYYLTRRGSVWLPEGYEATRPVPVDDYLERHPERLP